MVKVLPQVARLKGIALDFLFPQSCVGCGKEGAFLCLSCLKLLPRLLPPVCPKCGRPQVNGDVCPNCSHWLSVLAGIRSPFRFEGVMRQAIHELKYRNFRALAQPLACLLCDYLADNPLPADVLVPVPLHPKRLRERGYNQSRRLAREMGKMMNVPVVDDCLFRQRYTSPQTRTSSAEERKRNIANAFACHNDKLRDKQVLLIDDVATSGATLDACAAALKAAGASSVWGLVLAREI